jgi:hypothetical protein
MTIDEWTTAYLLQFGMAQAKIPQAVEGETDFLGEAWRDLCNCGHNPARISAIILINDEINRRTLRDGINTTTP